MKPVWQQHLQAVLESWAGTPWVAGQQLRGPHGGVDCVRFVVAVLDELHRMTRPAIRRLPQDASVHDRLGMMAAARAIRQRYPHAVIAAGAGAIEPGDVVVMQAGAAGGPGHVAIAGPGGARELWHATSGAGVVCTSAAASANIVWIWRPLGKEAW
jgi:cell wall-associated NlpC family hydrolase